jgi:hypothetical protein
VATGTTTDADRTIVCPIVDADKHFADFGRLATEGVVCDNWF